MAHNGRVTAVAALFLMMPAAQVLGQDESAAIRKLPQDIHFAGLAAAVQTALLLGDPNKPGMYVMRIRYPKGFKARPHFHSDGSRTIIVLSGTLYYAYGEHWDERKLEALPAGTFFTEPANTPHFVWAK